MAKRKTKEVAEELRAMNDEKLAEELGEAYKRLFTLRLQLTTRQQANTSETAKARHQIARIRTIQRERQLAEALGVASGR